jgi:hypothetical protein
MIASNDRITSRDDGYQLEGDRQIGSHHGLIDQIVEVDHDRRFASSTLR